MENKQNKAYGRKGEGQVQVGLQAHPNIWPLSL